jgi:predicted dehydrogenase/threonine dehydrogenase-like Zn-dependent dehydrogenase
MRQISQNYKTGAIRLQQVNPPALKPGGILVQTCFSVISTGTESMKAQEGKMSYVEKARARPDQVKKVLQTVQQQGLMATYRKVMHKLDSLTPLGYAVSGIVTAVGEGAEAFRIGQQVACAGVGYANHAEVNFVPKNLVVPVPDNVPMAHAAFATIGAIALHGFRQADMQLGETACVIGLGLVGQLLVQILGAAGVRVIGVDLVEARCQQALTLGAVAAGGPEHPGLRATIMRLTAGAGVDGIFLTASSKSNGPVEFAVAIARDRAKVIALGKTRLDLPWTDYYEKELDVRFSRSYGPGRYDPNYEERGIDYPIGYVRWTERQNMAAFLDLVAEQRVRLEPIITAIHPLSEAERVYEEIAAGTCHAVGLVFRYPEPSGPPRPLPALTTGDILPETTLHTLRLGVIGAGSFASSMLLPHLAKRDDVRLTYVATTSGLSAADAARKFGFATTTTDYRAVLSAADVDAVLIATRHAAHASMTAEALQAGKSVFVEKPLAIDQAGVELVHQAIVTSGNARLQVGFNRRFAPVLQDVAGVFNGFQTPVMMHYRVHAGQLEAGSWYLDPAQGSRVIGEAGHFFDVFAFLTGSHPVSVVATALRPDHVTRDDLDNVAVTVCYADGSVGNLLYLTQGSTKVPKEFLEVFGGGKTVQVHNFEALTIFEGNRQRHVKRRGVNKGHQEELQAFVTAVRSGSAMPIAVQSLLDTTLVTLAAAESLRTGQLVQLADS